MGDLRPCIVTKARTYSKSLPRAQQLDPHYTNAYIKITAVINSFMNGFTVICWTLAGFSFS
jgi:hypothetical protein